MPLYIVDEWRTERTRAGKCDASLNVAINYYSSEAIWYYLLSYLYITVYYTLPAGTMEY